MRLNRLHKHRTFHRHPIQLNYGEYVEAFEKSGLTVDRAIKLKRRWMFEYWVFVLQKSSKN